MSGIVSFRPEASDYLAVSRGSFLNGLRRRRFWVRVIAALVLGALIGGAVGAVDPQASLTGFVLLGVIAMIVWLSIVLASCYLLLPRRTRRLFLQQRTLDHDFDCAWDDKGFHQRWPGGTMTTPWADYHDSFESRAVIAFGLNEQLYHFIPKRVLDETALSDIRHHARAIEASRATL